MNFENNLICTERMFSLTYPLKYTKTYLKYSVHKNSNVFNLQLHSSFSHLLHITVKIKQKKRYTHIVFKYIKIFSENNNKNK